MLPAIGTKELIAWLPTLLGLGPDDVVVVPELAYPTYDVGAPAGRRAGAARRLADAARPAVAGAGLPQLAEQSDRRRARCRPSAQGRRVGARTRRDRRIRRVLPRPRLGCRTRFGAAPVGVRRRPHRTAGHSLAVEDLVAGRLPGGFRRRRSRRGRRTAGGAQARRDDDADAGAGCDGGRPRRRRARTRTAASATRDAATRCCPRCDRRASPSTTPRPGCTSGPAGASRAATPSDGSPSSGSSSRPASSTGRAERSTSGSR